MFRLKGKSLVCLLFGGFLAAGHVRADAGAGDSVLLVHEPTTPPRPELLLALRIQLTGAADVQARPLSLPSSMPARVEAVSALAHAENALAVVWTEGPVSMADGSQEAVVYVVAQSRGRALLEVVRVPGGDGSDVDRTLALKVREIVDQLRRGRTRSLAATLLAPPPAAAAAPAKPSAQWAATAALGLVAAAQPGTDHGHWGAALAAGPRFGTAAWRVSGSAALTLLPRVELHRAGASVGIQELAPALSLCGQAKQGPLWLGAHTGAALAFVAADGRSASGETGESSERVASWLIGGDAELPLGAGLGVSLAVELQVHLRRQRFAVDGNEVVDMGIVRPLALLALTWTASTAE